VTVGSRLRRSGNEASHHNVERIDTNTEASKTNESEGHPDDPALDRRRRFPGAQDCRAAENRQQLGFHLFATGSGSRDFMAFADCFG
jgi:hypothetical protein